ncbi:MAG: response regulator [bacterium]|nr:response regulator [bacterium]
MPENPIKVLLLEDNPGDARLIREMLMESDEIACEVLCLDRLSAGLEYLAQESRDIVLLDLGLPDSTGLDTVTKLYQQQPTLPVVVLTGLDDKTVAVKAIQNGAQDYVVKGDVDGKLLVRSIRYAIERKRVEKALIKSEILLKETQQITKVGGWEYDVQNKKIIWTDEVYNIYGVSRDYDPNKIEQV